MRTLTSFAAPIAANATAERFAGAIARDSLGKVQRTTQRRAKALANILGLAGERGALQEFDVLALHARRLRPRRA